MNLSIDWTLLSLGIVELILTIIMSIIMVFIGYWAFTLFTKKIKETEELKNKNTAVGILSASVIISMGIMLKSAVDPSITTLRLLIKGGINLTDILIAVGFFLMFFALTMIIALFVILLSSFLFNKLTTNIDEYTEIKNNNIGVAIVFGAVIISISILVLDGISAVISGIQPWPEPVKNEDIPTKIGMIGEFFKYIV